MAADKDTIRSWLKSAPAGSTNMAVYCDTFDWTDYPSYITATDEQDCREQVEKHGGRLMEVYSLNRDIESQLSEHRAYHYD